MRLFIAVDVDAGVRAGLTTLIERLRPLAPEARWVQPESIHLTLVFLGHLPEENLGTARDAVAAAARQAGPLTLHARSGGHFGSSRKPRVLWVGLEGDLALLERLKLKAEEGLTPVGYEPEHRPFAPHLTLARARDPHGDPNLAACSGALAEVDLGRFRVEALTLFRSDLSPKGARYTPLFSPPLSG